MHVHPPDPDFLQQLVRYALGRGVPPQVAEDIVFEAWERGSSAFDPSKGTFEALLQTSVRNATASYWRSERRKQRVVEALVPPSSDTRNEERADARQVELLSALGPEERKVFAAWALQKHLGKGRVTSAGISASIGLETADFENAKRRLRARLLVLLNQFGWTTRGLIHGEDHV